MSLEQNIIALTEALTANTAALLGGGKPAAAGKATTEKAAAGKTAAAKTSKYTEQDVKDAAVKIVDAQGKPAAKKLIKDAGKADAMADIKPENREAFIDACEAALAGDGDGGDDAGDGL